MYNRQSCRECGCKLEPFCVCLQCREQLGWVCVQCGRTEDYSRIHAREGSCEGALQIIEVVSS
jgi:hypothetical protein